jgi:hypothetical protein
VVFEKKCTGIDWLRRGRQNAELLDQHTMDCLLCLALRIDLINLLLQRRKLRAERSLDLFE